ncbi:MAG: ATP-dependent endonuclease, partial [Candidatus Magasanikbacteria bacterium]
KGGLFIIDEPELHLHPQIQKKYLDLINKESKNKDIQFVLVTHSDEFINHETISNIHRFYIENNFTKTKHPGNSLKSSDEELIKLLDYTENSRVFFSEKVLLVEGPDDRVFFNRLLDKYAKRGYFGQINKNKISFTFFMLSMSISV